MKYVISLAASKGKHGIYHISTCPHAKRIRYKNRKFIKINEISDDIRPCKYCNDDSKYLNRLIECARECGTYKALEISQVGSRLIYVRTTAGFWKIYLSERRELYVFHRNCYRADYSFDELIKGKYHRQTEVSKTWALNKILYYIKQHDEAKLIIKEDWQKLPTKTKKQRKYYRYAEKRDKKKQLENVFSLFEQLEAKDPSLKRDSIR